MITFDTDPRRYRHWRLACDGPIATLTLDVAEEGGLFPGYRLKLNSYDLGVDIELHDALNRIRFEHPEVRVVVLTSGKERVFCAGANIYMLGQASHAEKVNFCKFTNETRNGIEDSSAHSGLKFIAAVNGACAGGGYELALACDEIVMIDDRSSTVSLPEVALLGVLPGTGGLTRLVDKRKVRRDLADVFCTTAEGVRADRAKAWKLVDRAAPPGRFQAARRGARPRTRGRERPPGRCRRCSARAARTQHRRARLPLPLGRGRHRVPEDRVATLTVSGPRSEEAPGDLAGIIASRRALVAAGDGARVGRCALDAAHQPSRDRHRGAEDIGRGGGRAGLRPRRWPPTGTTGSCARRSACCAALCSGSMSPRAASSPSSTRARALPAACSSWRSPPTAATCRRRDRGSPFLPSTSGISRWSTAAPGWRPASTTTSPIERSGVRHPSMRPQHSISVWSPSPRTSSTGRTKSGSRSRNARASRPTR